MREKVPTVCLNLYFVCGHLMNIFYPLCQNRMDFVSKYSFTYTECFSPPFCPNSQVWPFFLSNFHAHYWGQTAVNCFESPLSPIVLRTQCMNFLENWIVTIFGYIIFLGGELTLYECISQQFICCLVKMFSIMFFWD